jgi:predicted Zn-dependent peptidase
MRGAICIALALAAAPAHAAKEAPPPVGPPPAIRLPAIRELALENGLRVSLVPFGDVPRATVSLVLRAGNADAPEKQIAVPDLLAALLKEGTETRDATALARDVADLGGALETQVTLVETEITSDVLREHTPAMVRIVADVVQRPALPERELARLKTDLARQLAMAHSEPQTLANESFNRAMYGAHPFGRRDPKPEEVEGYTMAEVRAFYAQYGAARARLYVVGSFDADAVEAAVREAFGPWAKGPPAALPPIKPTAARSVVLIDRPGAVQSTIRVGLPVVAPTDPDYLTLAVANAMLGGAFMSRITSNIREAKGYTYSPYSLLSPLPGIAAWVEMADVKSEVTGAALKEIVKEIDALAVAPPPAAELQAHQSLITGLFLVSLATRNGILARLRTMHLLGLPADYLETYVARVMAVKPKDIQRVVRAHFRSAKMAIIVVGDKGTVGKQLTPFGKVVAAAP